MYAPFPFADGHFGGPKTTKKALSLVRFKRTETGHNDCQQNDL